MKMIRRNMTMMMTAAIAALCVTGTAFADNNTTPGRLPGGDNLDFLAGYLSLTDAQKAQAKTIFDAANTASATVEGQMTAARDALAAAVKANSSDSELDRLSAAVGVLHGQLEAIRAKANAKFYALLTADQKTKYDALLNRRGGGGGFRN